MFSQIERVRFCFILVKKNMVIVPGIILALTSLLAILDENSCLSMFALWNNKSFLWQVYKQKKNTNNSNHTFLIFVKLLFGIPINKNEEPWDTYQHIKTHEKENWPYLMRIDATTSQRNTLSLPNGENESSCINFSSYSYVSAVKDHSIRKFVFEEMIKGNYAFGNHGPRMLGGNNKWLCTLEASLAEFTGREACITYSSGFLACKTVVQAVAGKEDAIFGDSKLHESLRDGIRCAKMKGCKSYVFQHNELDHLESLLKQHRTASKNAYIITEELFSMDADYPDLHHLKLIATKYDAKIILDAAHSMGILGKTGRGLEELQNCPNVAWLIVGSFTKALGSVGGYCCGEQKIIDFLHFFSTGTMFSAPMSVPNAIAAYATLEEITYNPQWIEETNENSEFLKEQLKPLEKKHNVVVQSFPKSPIIMFIMTNFHPRRCMVIATELKKFGYYVACVNPPAVALREPRFRLTAPRGIKTSEIFTFVAVLDKLCNQTTHIKSQILEDLEPWFETFGL